MTVYKLHHAQNGLCEIHGIKLNFESISSQGKEHFFITDSGNIIQADMLIEIPLIYSSIVQRSIYDLFTGQSKANKNKLFRELESLNMVDDFKTIEPITDGYPIEFFNDYSNNSITIIQAEKLFCIDGLNFYKSHHTGWYVTGEIDNKVLHILDADTVINGKKWYEHLNSDFQKKLKTIDFNQLHDFPFPNLAEPIFDTIPNIQDRELETYKDCVEITIHNDHLNLKLFGQILLNNKSKHDSPLLIMFCPKTLEFHAVLNNYEHHIAKSLAELIFHYQQEAYGQTLYKAFMTSNSPYALTLDNHPTLKENVTTPPITFKNLFNLQSYLHRNNAVYNHYLPIIYGELTTLYVGYDDQTHYGSEYTYMRHNALMQDAKNQYVLIRFSEYQVSEHDLGYDVDEKEKYNIECAGMTRLYRFTNDAELKKYLIDRVKYNRDLLSILQFAMKDHSFDDREIPYITFE